MTGSNVTILNVDDNEACLYVKSRILRRAGYGVIEATTGNEVQPLAESTRPQLVLLDVKLPDINGFEVCRRIKSNPVTASVLVLQISASFIGGKDRLRALEGGADGYLTEPIAPEELLANIKALLRLRRTEAALREAAEAATRAKDEFLALVSHELRTPLNAVLGWIHVLRQHKADNVTVEHALEVIERSTRTQLQLVDDLLDISRIIRGKLRLEIRPFNLMSLLETACDNVRPAAEARGINLRLILDSQHRNITGDPDRLQQVIWNLLSNAIKFTPGGGSIDLRLESDNSNAHITVSDTGKGIDPEFLPYIFDRFSQGDTSATRRQGGLGLGLALVRHLVELHGGSVGVTSQGEGRGASFTVIIPLRANETWQRAGDREGHIGDNLLDMVSSPETFRMNNLRVLVVSVEEQIGEMVRTVLERHGATVAIAASSAEALGILTVKSSITGGAHRDGPHPDLLLIDISSFGEEGYRLIDQLRQLPLEEGGRIPAIALTPQGRVEDRLRVLRAGFQMYLPKPVEPAELVTVVASLTARLG